MWNHNHTFKDFDRFFVGFDKVAEKMATIADQTAKLATNYPPYNLKKVDENKYIIEMAVAGFGKQDLEIELADNKLIIKGNVHSGEPAEEDSQGAWTFPHILYQGLAMRPFTRTFTLADNVEIRNADMLNGILRIVLEAIIPEHKKPVKIEIKDADEYPSEAAESIAEGKVK
jgi:molecular chaperone IbpA